MMGFWVVIMALAVLSLPVLWLMAYGMEGVFLRTVLAGNGGWIPVYRQVLLGRLSGAEGLGQVTALGHGSILVMGALIFLTQWDGALVLGIGVMTAVCAVLSECLAWRIYAIGAPEDRRLFLLLDLLTFGLTRPVFLLSLRHRMKSAGRHM